MIVLLCYCFWTGIVRIPRMYANFVEEEYRSVFAIALPYTNPFKWVNYTYTENCGITIVCGGSVVYFMGHPCPQSYISMNQYKVFIPKNAMFNVIIMMTSKLLVTHKHWNPPKSRGFPSITCSVYLVHRREKMAQVVEFLIYYRYLL